MSEQTATKPKVRSLILQGWEVRAILEGRKTQKRFPVGQIDWPAANCPQMVIDGEWYPTTNSGKVGTYSSIRCPYGQVGDRLLVKETWHPSARWGTEYAIEYKADGKELVVEAGFEGPTPRIDAVISEGWQKPQHMPNWAARLTLEIVSLRVERLHDMSEEDAIAVGITGRVCPALAWLDNYNDLGLKPELNWHDNPWLWVMDFKVVPNG